MPRFTNGWTRPARRTTPTTRPRAGRSPIRSRTEFRSMRPTLLSSRAPRRPPDRTRSFRTGWTASSGSSRPNASPAGSTRWRLTRRCRRLLTTAAAPTGAWIATTAARPMSGPSRWSRSDTAVRSWSAPRSRGGPPETSPAPASCPAPSTARTRSPQETSPSGELGRDAHAAQLRRFDRPRDRSGFLRLLDEFADVGERRRAPFRQRDRHFRGREAVLQHARAGKIVRESQQHVAVLRIDLRLAFLDQVERGRQGAGLRAEPLHAAGARRQSSRRARAGGPLLGRRDVARAAERAPGGARLCQRIRPAVEEIRNGLAGDRNGEAARRERRALAHRKVKFPAVIAFGPLKVPGTMPGPATFPAVRPVNEVRTRIGRRCRIGTTAMGPT